MVHDSSAPEESRSELLGTAIVRLEFALISWVIVFVSEITEPALVT